MLEKVTTLREEFTRRFREGCACLMDVELECRGMIGALQDMESMIDMSFECQQQVKCLQKSLDTDE